MSFSNLGELTYRSLIGPLGQKSTVWAQCLFVDPIADIAVLGAPDGLELWEKFDAYRTFLEHVEPLPMGAPGNQTAAWLMSLDNSWHSCTAHPQGGGLWLASATAGIAPRSLTAPGNSQLALSYLRAGHLMSHTLRAARIHISPATCRLGWPHDALTPEIINQEEMASPLLESTQRRQVGELAPPT